MVKKPTPRRKDHPEKWPDREMVEAFEKLIDALGGSSHGRKGGGVQKLASEMGVSANIVHYWRREVQGVEPKVAEANKKVKLVPTAEQAIKLGRIEAKSILGKGQTVEEACRKWLHLTGRDNKEGADLLQAIEAGPERELLVSTEALFADLEKRLEASGLTAHRPPTAIAAYFTQAAYRKSLTHWRPTKRRLAIFWGAESSAFPPRSEERPRKAMHELFKAHLAAWNVIDPYALGNSPPKPASFSTGIDIYVTTGQTRSRREDLRQYIRRCYKPASEHLPGVRFFEAKVSQKEDELDLEHLADAFVFHGEDGKSKERDFMLLIGEVDQETLSTLSLATDPIFANPYMFSSQIMRLDWGKALDFLERRKIRLSLGALQPDPEHWEQVSLDEHERWQLNGIDT